MGNSPDDEALARELHRELNVGPRRRQRRQAAPPNRSNISHKRARSAGSTSRDSTTNDDSDEFSDRVITRSAPKPGQHVGSEPKEDGQVESMPKSIDPLQRSQTAPDPNTADISTGSGPAHGLKTADPNLPVPKPCKQGSISVVPKCHNPALARKHGVPLVHKQATPPKSPRHKKPKTSPPAAVKPPKDTHMPRPPSLPVPHQSASRQQPVLPASQKSFADSKLSLSSKFSGNSKGPGQLKHPYRITQASSPTTKYAGQDSTRDEGNNATTAMHKERPNHSTMNSLGSEKHPPPVPGRGKMIQSGTVPGKGSASDGAAAIVVCPTMKLMADQLKKTAPQKSQSKLNGQKPVVDAKSKTLTHDYRPKLVSEQRQMTSKCGSEPRAKLSPMEQQTAVSPQATDSTHDVAAMVHKARATAIKVTDRVQNVVTAVKNAGQSAVVAQQTAPGSPETAIPAPRIRLPPPKDAAATKGETAAPAQVIHKHVLTAPAVPPAAASPARTGGVFAPVAPSATASRSDERMQAAPPPQTESPHAASIDQGRLDIASAGSTPRAPESHQIGASGASQQRNLHGSANYAANAGAAGRNHDLDNVNDGSGAALPQAAQIKTEMHDGGPARALGSSIVAKNEAFDLMNLCPAHSEVGSLLCQETGSGFCVWLRVDDISSRAQLRTALSTLYPGAQAASIDCSELEVTLVNLRGKQYFHFPAHAEFALQGNVAWQEAMAQATHMLLTV